MKNKISIALATYNGEKYIREQMDSLCAQNILPSEVIVSDDCSTDSTINIIKEYTDKLNIIILENSTNKGVNKNFEAAIKACTGDYILLCDQDDIWCPDKIEVLYNHILRIEQSCTSNTPILVSSEAISFYNLEEVNRTVRQNEGIISDKKKFLFNNVFYCQGTTMAFNRTLLNILPPFPTEFKDFSYDGYIAMFATLNGKREHIKYPLLFYRRHENNVIGKNVKKTFKQKMEKKLSSIIYNFYHIPYSRQKHYSDFVRKDIIDKTDTIFYNNVVTVGLFYNAKYWSKFKYIFKVKEQPFGLALKQTVKLFLTAPLRLFISPDA